ncbi:uncharacterized protein LOC122524294 [Polistes fuscatus]|uniref:uncharacterized protein LOC122524294 n=1 Tax=Polistes fuscatus TaxID=30207 RepID=UPI001CAA0336|nr:uncharacterized protein LOC122524294 [Polistes fuscatus]
MEANTSNKIFSPFIHVCGLRNPKLNECISKSIMALREKLSDGIPELNIPSTKAFVLNDLTFINQTDLNISSKKAIIYGVDKFTNYFTGNITIDIKSNFEMIKKNNKKFVYFNSINVKMNIADLDANIKKTAENENSVIVMAVNTILGTNKADINRAIVPNIEKGISINLINIINNIFTKYEFDELFPDRE